MSYVIQSYSFSKLEKSNIKLPRFQRRAAWKDEQNFKLCISIFKEFPTGVMIINQNEGVSWLLDGRQRRNAMLKMREDPVNIYEWGQSFIGFKTNSDQEEVSNLFWTKIEEYLQSDKAVAVRTVGKKSMYGDVDSHESKEEEEQLVYSYETSDEPSFDPTQQFLSLQTLLDLILMIHQKKKGSMSKWERNFDFFECFSYLPYYSKKVLGQEKIDRKELKEFILTLHGICMNNGGKISIEPIIDYLTETFPIHDKKKDNFIKHMKQHGKEICESIDIIKRTDDIFEAAEIGVILLRNVTELDAQNIFSLVNSGGTQLKAEELLSAKRFWNEPVTVDEKVKMHIDKLYRAIGLDVPEHAVKWDIPATLLSRIDNKNLIFKKYDESGVDMNKISLGFKLLSSIKNGGVSAKHVNSFEKNDFDNWEGDIDEIIDAIDTIIENLLTTSYFTSLNSWGKSIDELLGNGIALEFITILYKRWIELNQPKNSAVLTKFFRESLALLDLLIFEYSTRAWRGSGDSKLASDLMNYPERLKAIDSKRWCDFIDEASKGTHNGTKTSATLLAPLLYHANALSRKKPIGSVDINFEVDHIMPQEKLKDNSFVNQNYINCLSNLSLLPKKKNGSKSSKYLIDLDRDLKKAVSEYSWISLDDFEKYSDVLNIDCLIEERQKKFKKIFEETRASELSNISS
jgi:Protein of unknown function DUF262./Uncharacterized conserved protein (DUF2081).